MVAPSFELVPATRTHSSALIAVESTERIASSWVVLERSIVAEPLVPLTVSVLPLSAVIEPARRSFRWTRETRTLSGPRR